MEIVLELLSSIVGHAFSWLIGFVYMHVKYRSAKKRNQVLDDEFDGSYAFAGNESVSRFWVLVWIAIVVLFVIAAVFLTPFQ